jgi:hypothetical protein
MLVMILAVLLASLIGAGIRALFNAGKPKNQPVNLHQGNYNTLAYQFQNDGGSGTNNLPMYVIRNNSQTGPYRQQDVLNWINSGQFSPFDLAIKQGETQWQPLNMYFAVKPNQ